MDCPAAPTSEVDTLLYLPRYDCHSGELTGAELYSALDGQPRAVTLGASGEASLAMLRAASTQMARWNHTRNRPLTLALAAELDLLCDTDVAHRINGILLEACLAPGCLEFHIHCGKDGISAEECAALAHLKTCGVRFMIDVSSGSGIHLAALHAQFLDGMKIPASLARDVTADPEGVAIARALASRAHRLKLAVCAEGIDSPLHASVMEACGADILAGPYLGAALRPAEFGQLLADGRRLDGHLIRDPIPRKTLLLVDDEDNILSSLRRLLRRDGYTILTASGGQQGLEILAANPVDVIVSDQRMPGMTGVEFLRKAKDMVPDTVRMVLSGYTDLQSVTNAINEGAIYKFLTKPWDDAMLRANIEEAFRRKALADDNRRLGAELQQANQELARMNERLKSVLAEQERRLGLDEAALSMTQEALAVMPLPVIGVDPGGMIAFCNRAAEALFSEQPRLLGQDAVDVLPADFHPLLSAGEGKAEILCGTRLFRVEAHTLGAFGHSRGCLLTFTCAKPAA
ncbi:response regulator [Zoogloea sp.]|uniref:response regulator n=1 Tax=Zoogloea sp. TaxID=49181 RepID=UPI00261AE848|nr:response regulator [Zoogloea sp.]MDD3353191.1 response regulator [Zoogloea sp.]